MGDLINDEDQFKTSDKFIQELDALEYNNCDGSSNRMARMSLFRQFDPLVDQTKSSPLVSIHVSNINTSANQQHSITTNENEIPEEGSNHQNINLIHLNTSIKNDLHEKDVDISRANGNSSYTSDSHNQEQIVQMNEEIGILESKNENLELLIGQLALTNEDIVNLAMLKLSNFQKAIDEKEEELNKQSLIISQLEDDINGVEKNYYEIHSRYDNLRSLVKEMDQKESQNKTRIQEISNKLREKEQECRKWRHQAEEAIETANQRIQSNNETVSLKAQIKVLEMRVNSLQSQIDQKNRENEELSNIVNELIATNKAN